MRIGIQERERNGKYHASEEGGFHPGRNGGFHDVEGIEERRWSVEEG